MALLRRNIYGNEIHDSFRVVHVHKWCLPKQQSSGTNKRPCALVHQPEPVIGSKGNEETGGAFKMGKQWSARSNRTPAKSLCESAVVTSTGRARPLRALS